MDSFFSIFEWCHKVPSSFYLLQYRFCQYFYIFWPPTQTLTFCKKTYFYWLLTLRRCKWSVLGTDLFKGKFFLYLTYLNKKLDRYIQRFLDKTVFQKKQNLFIFFLSFSLSLTLALSLYHSHSLCPSLSISIYLSVSFILFYF